MHNGTPWIQPLGGADYVRETAFGTWFLDTQTWVQHVLHRALDDLQRLMDPARHYADVLDVGCGRGRALPLLDQRFKPQRIVAMDPEDAVRAWVDRVAPQCQSAVRFHAANAALTGLPDASFDLVFCHQTFHHIVDQAAAMSEFHRVLKPGGVLLFAESTIHFIHSWSIRLLFRHPMDVQKTADEYIALIRRAGFQVPEKNISLPYTWWSRADLGLLEKLGFPPRPDHDQTLVNLVAVKAG